MLDNTEDIIIKVLRAVPELEKGESKDIQLAKQTACLI